MIYNPRKRFNISLDTNSYTVFDLNRKYTIDPNEFLSKGKSTCFNGKEVYGRCLLTVYKGKVVYKE